MTDPTLNARVLTGLLNDRQEAAQAKALTVVDPPAIWVPTTHVKQSTPLDIVRGIAATHPWPDAWEQKLREISPKSDATSWLYGAWLHHASRWVLYECLPYPLIPEGKRVQLMGTPYWEMPKHLRAGRKQAVSAFQWEMYRKHKVWARPFWVLQGTDGGTPAKYTEVEEAILQAQGKDTEPPPAGDLPFAPFDERAERAIRKRDRLTQMQHRIEKLRASGNTDALKAETVLAEEMFRKEFWAWWTETLQPQAEFWAWRSAKEDAPFLTRQATTAEQIAAEQTEEQFLTSGDLPAILPDGRVI